MTSNLSFFPCCQKPIVHGTTHSPSDEINIKWNSGMALIAQAVVEQKTIYIHGALSRKKKCSVSFE